MLVNTLSVQNGRYIHTISMTLFIFVFLSWAVCTPWLLCCLPFWTFHHSFQKIWSPLAIAALLMILVFLCEFFSCLLTSRSPVSVARLVRKCLLAFLFLLEGSRLMLSVYALLVAISTILWNTANGHILLACRLSCWQYHPYFKTV